VQKKFSKLIKKIFRDINLTEKEGALLFSVFIYKSFCKPNFSSSTFSIDYVNSDLFLKEFYNKILNFTFFYTDQKMIVNAKNFKKETFKLMNCLIYEKIVIFKKIRTKDRTIIE
jgi:hypothetical protein